LFLVDRTIPLKVVTQPHRLPAELIVDESVRSYAEGALHPPWALAMACHDPAPAASGESPGVPKLRLKPPARNPCDQV